MSSCIYECIRNRERLEKESKELQENIRKIKEEFEKRGYKVTVYVRRKKC